MKRMALAVAVSVVLAGVAVASVLASTMHSANSSENRPHGAGASTKAEDAGVHGGPIDRFHGSGSCDLTSVSALPGNWTHGDYVSAVAMATGDSTMIVEAAQSDCGKPMVAVNHGGSPIARSSVRGGPASAGACGGARRSGGTRRLAGKLTGLRDAIR